MPLRVLCHDLFSGSYESQLLNGMGLHDLEDILHDLTCHSYGLFGETSTPIAATLTKIGWCAIAYKVSSLLDGNLVRKTAETCRKGYDLICEYHLADDIEEVRFIYDHLCEHFKFSRHPMPIIRHTI